LSSRFFPLNLQQRLPIASLFPTTQRAAFATTTPPTSLLKRITPIANLFEHLPNNATISSKTTIGSRIEVAGWVRTSRLQGGGSFAFIELSDGSCQRSLQIIADHDTIGWDAHFQSKSPSQRLTFLQSILYVFN